MKMTRIRSVVRIAVRVVSLAGFADAEPAVTARTGGDPAARCGLARLGRSV